MIFDILSGPLHTVAIINLLLWLAGCGYVFYGLRAPLYHPITLFMVYHGFGFVVRPFVILINGYSDIWDRTGITPLVDDIYFTAVLSNICMTAVLIGTTVGGKFTGTVPAFQPIQLTIKYPARYYAAMAFLAALGLYANYRSYAGGGLESVLAYEVSFDSAGAQRLVGISGYVTALAEFLPVICIFLYLNEKTRAIAWAATTAYVAIRFYAGAQRLSFVVVLLSLLLIWLINTRRRYPPIKAVIAALCFMLVFDIIGGDRYAFRRLIEGEAGISQIVDSYQEKRANAALVNDLSEFDVASSVLSIVPERTGWSYGSQYLRILVWPIPRQLWPNKPIYTSRIVLSDYGLFFALTHTLYVDSYMVWGVSTAVGILALVGFALGRLYRAAGATTSPIIFMLFWLQLIYVKTLFRDGGVTVFYFLIFSMIATIILTWTGKVRLCRSAME